jgi:MFS family permease
LMRGRVMALYSVVFLGSTPIGAPLVGWIAQVAGPRAGLAVGAVAALVTAAGAKVAFDRVRPAPEKRRPCESSSRTRTGRPLPTLETRP